MTAISFSPGGPGRSSSCARSPLSGATAFCAWADRPAKTGAVAAAAAVGPSALSTFIARYIGAFGAAVLFVFPFGVLFFLGGGGALKWIDNYGIQILIYVMLGWGLNIVVGLAGLLDLGYVAFYAVGAYSYALLATTFGLSFWICLPLAGILAALWGMILGFPVLRLRGDYLAIVTLAFGEIIRLILINWVAFSGRLRRHRLDPARHLLRPVASATNRAASPNSSTSITRRSTRKIFLYYLILCLALHHQFRDVAPAPPADRARLGGAARGRDRLPVAGHQHPNTKLTAFALGAFFGGLAGSFFAVRQGFISPESFTFNESATILAIVVLGGMGSQIGVALAAVFLIGGFELLRELDFLRQLMATVFGIPDFDPAQYRGLLFGLAWW